MIVGMGDNASESLPMCFNWVHYVMKYNIIFCVNFEML